MDLVLLKTFLKVVALGNITKAAAVLFVTQSAVSRRIQQLESYVGKPLLERSGPLLAPTEAGHLLIVKARRMLDIEQELMQSLGIIPAKEKISFCCTPALGIGRLSGLLSSFVDSNAATVDLNCVFAMPEEAMAGIRSGRFDLALIEHCDEVDLSGHFAYPLPDDDVFFVSAPSLGIDPGHTSLERLFAQRLYLMQEKGCAKRFIDRNLSNLGHTCGEFSAITYFDDFNFIISEVLAGKGITLFSSGLVIHEIESGRLRRHVVSGFSQTRPRTLILPGRHCSPYLLDFIETIFTSFGVPCPQELNSAA